MAGGIAARAAGKAAAAIEQAGKLRQSGKVVELALSAQTEQAAQESRQLKGYKELVYLA